MEFPYGKAAFILLLLALVTGATVALSSHSAQVNKPDIIFATFAKEHAAAYQSVIDNFERERGVHVQMQIVSQVSLQGRLQAALQVGADVPDLVELLDGTMGIFTKGPLKDVGLVDLTDRIHAGGWDQRILASRFPKWSSRGRVFALPHDVHPAMLCYRRDLIEKLGIDVNSLTTWDQFVKVGHDVTRDLDGDGVPDRYMVDLPAEGIWALRLLMLQRGQAMFNDAGDVTFDSDTGTDVVCWFVRQVEGPTRIAFPCGWGQNLAKSMIDGLVLFYFCPDWRTKQFEMDVPSMNGKLALMPLPAWTPGGRRTSTWGGTGIAITRSSKHIDLAWDLALRLYYEQSELGRRFEDTNILPPLKDAWTLPEFRAPRPFFSNEPIGSMYAELALQVPVEAASPYNTLAELKLGEAYTNVRIYYREHGETGLEDYARAELHRCADLVRVSIHRNVFLEASR